MFKNPRPFADYIRGVNSAFNDAMNDIKPLPHAADFPCSLCNGLGALAKKSSYEKINESGEIKSRHGFVVITNEVVMCCACIGTGVDQSKVVEALKQEAELQAHLESMA